MYENIGNKIRALATTFFVVIATISVMIGFILMTGTTEFVFLGLAVMIVGSLIGWISSWVLYGFGEIIVRLTAIDQRLSCSSQNTNEQVQNKSSGLTQA